MIFETIILIIWFVAGMLALAVNGVMFFVLARNWNLFVRWKKSDERILAEGIAKMVVRDITDPKFEDEGGK